MVYVIQFCRQLVSRIRMEHPDPASLQRGCWTDTRPLDRHSAVGQTLGDSPNVVRLTATYRQYIATDLNIVLVSVCRNWGKHWSRHPTSLFRYHLCMFFDMAQEPPKAQLLPSIEASRLHSDTPHSVGLPWTSDQSEAETSPWLNTTQQTYIHAAVSIRTLNPSKPVAAETRLRPRGHWDRPIAYVLIMNIGQGWTTDLSIGHIPAVPPHTT
jgi:hypothetical protein